MVSYAEVMTTIFSVLGLLTVGIIWYARGK